MLKAELPESHCRTDLTRTPPPLALTEHPPPSLRLLLPQEVTLVPTADPENQMPLPPPYRRFWM